MTYREYWETQYREQLLDVTNWITAPPPEYFESEPQLTAWQRQVLQDYSRLAGDATMNGTIPFMVAYRYYREIYDLTMPEIDARLQCFRVLEQADREYQDEKRERTERVKGMLGEQFNNTPTATTSWTGD